MPGPYIADDVLRQRVQDAYGSDLQPWWDTVVTDSNHSAAGSIDAILGNRGFTPAQIAQWDQRKDYNIDIGMFWSFTKGGIPAGYSDLMISKLDRRKELESVPVLVNGVVVTPGNTDFNVSGGRMSEAGYRFSMDTQF